METTLNIHVDILSKITQAAQLKSLSRSDMIILLIKRIMYDAPDTARSGKMIRYQNRRKTDEWHVFHVRLRMDDYEYFLDLRRLFKMSVSLILAYAVEKYLAEVLKTTISDNYQFISHTIIREVIDNITTWRLMWGFSINSIHKLRL